MKSRLIHGRSCVYNINYHIVWSVKYRRKILTHEIESYLRLVAMQIACANGFQIHLFEAGERDHVHCFVSAPPTMTISHIVKILKGTTSRYAFEYFPELKRSLWGGIYGTRLITWKLLVLFRQKTSGATLRYRPNNILWRLLFMATNKPIHKRKSKKVSEFQSSQVKSSRLNGYPNKEKSNALRQIQEDFTADVRRYISVLSFDDTYLPYILMRKQRDPVMRELEKKLRSKKLGAAMGQAAFDYAVDQLATRLENIKNEVYSVCPNLMTSSKVLFYMVLQHKTRGEMVAEFQEIADSYKSEDKNKFYLDGIKTLKAYTDKEFHRVISEINMWYQFISDSYKLPDVKRAWVRVVSTAGSVAPSENIDAPFVMSVMNPAKHGDRIEVPLYTSSNTVRRLNQYGPKQAYEWNLREDGILEVQVAYEKKHEVPEFTEYRGVDVGITDMLFVSDGSSFGSFKDCIDFYKTKVEPLLGQISTLRNNKRNLKKFLRKHKDLPDEARKAIRDKMDRLETAIRKSRKAYKNLNSYKNMLSRDINKAIKEYIASLNGDKGIVTVLELLDIHEFNKSKKTNGELSMFARGLLSSKLMEALNWYGYSFKQIEPAYTSQCCPVCSYTDKANRDGKVFKCKCCGHTDDADHVGSVNIKARATDDEITAIVQQYHGDERQTKIKALCNERNAAWKLLRTEAAPAAI